MTVAEIKHPFTGEVYRLGRYPSQPQRHLHLADFIKPDDLPKPPIVCHYSPLAEHGLAMILANDRLGDCTSAGASHLIDLWQGNSLQTMPVVSDADAIAFYSKTCGYVAGDESTDRGGNLVDVMKAWKSNGFFSDGSSKINGWVSVDATNRHQMMTALWLFEGLYMGVGLPDEWIDPPPSSNGFVWGVNGEADQNNGHCIVAVGYNGQGIQIDSWGKIGTITWDAMAKYFSAAAQGEVYAILSPDAIIRATKKATSGFDIDSLTAMMEKF